MKNLIHKEKSTTLILIAHRLSTLLNCNYVIKFDEGKIDKIFNKQEFLESFDAND